MTAAKPVTVRIFVTCKDGEHFEITDLYWFEENGVHDFSGEGRFENFVFSFVIEEKTQ